MRQIRKSVLEPGMIFSQETLLVALGLGIYDIELFHMNCFSKEIPSLRIRQTEDDI